LLAQALGLKWQSSDRKDVMTIDEKSQAIVEVVINTLVVIADM